MSKSSLSPYAAVCALRGERELKIDMSNSNRYRIVAYEGKHLRTAYCFSVPIYNKSNRTLLAPAFRKSGLVYSSLGSNAQITVGNEIVMTNEDGTAKILCCSGEFCAEKCLMHDSSVYVQPTLNGILLKIPSTGKAVPRFIICVDKPNLEIRANSKGFSWMIEEFRPFVTASVWGIADKKYVLRPAAIEICHSSPYTIEFCIECDANPTHETWVEINLYEPKLFQDTTVESAHTEENNAFGSTAFLGHTDQFGEQWLYSRFDFSKLPDFFDVHINKAILHIPVVSRSVMTLCAHKISARFCSFGSTWQSKMASKQIVAKSDIKSGYCSFDMTSALVDDRAGASDGFLIRSAKNNGNFCVLATGDSFYRSQIMEINYSV